MPLFYAAFIAYLPEFLLASAGKVDLTTSGLFSPASQTIYKDIQIAKADKSHLSVEPVVNEGNEITIYEVKKSKDREVLGLLGAIDRLSRAPLTPEDLKDIETLQRRPDEVKPVILGENPLNLAL